MALGPTGPRPISGIARFGQRLRHWRKSAALTQAELGRALRYHHSYISKVEAGSRWPPREVAVRCDDLLGAGRELAELWSLADRERRLAMGSPGAEPVLAGLVSLLAGYAEADPAGGGNPMAEAVEWQRDRLVEWLASAPRPLLRQLIDLGADQAGDTGLVRAAADPSLKAPAVDLSSRG